MSVCEGSLEKEAQFLKSTKKNIRYCDMDISDLTTWFKDLDSHLINKRIATEVIKEIKDRLNFLMNVGLIIWL
jgi:excinuclease ABC subunit A